MLEELRRYFSSRDEPYGSVHGDAEQHVRVESVEIDASSEAHEVVILLRDLKRPECSFGWRAPAVEPGVLGEDLGPYRTVKDAAESHAMVVAVNLEEDLAITDFVRGRPCTPGAVGWF